MEYLNPDNIDWKIAEYHIMGDSNPVIGEKLGLNKSTVWRRLQTPECQAAINTIRNIYYNTLATHVYAGAIEASNFVRKKLREEDATVSAAVAYLRIAKDIYSKDYILYESEDAEFISKAQNQKNFNLEPTIRLDKLHLSEEE